MVGDEVLDATVVRMVAERDGLTDAQARERVADTLRLVAAARDEAARQGADPAELVSETRRAHLLRAARARLWLQTEFEPKHRASDIPRDTPALLQARASPHHVRPRLHRICQLLAVLDGDDREENLARAQDPAWRARARPVFERAVARAQRYVPDDDPQACDLLGKLLSFDASHVDDVRLRIETGAFDLDACAREDPDGTCVEPRWDRDWTEAVGKASGPGFLPPFTTQFGFHLVYVVEILEPRDADDPEVEATIVDAVLPAWRRERLAEILATLRQKRSVRVAREP